MSTKPMTMLVLTLSAKDGISRKTLKAYKTACGVKNFMKFGTVTKEELSSHLPKYQSNQNQLIFLYVVPSSATGIIG